MWKAGIFKKKNSLKNKVRGKYIDESNRERTLKGEAISKQYKKERVTEHRRKERVYKEKPRTLRESKRDCIQEETHQGHIIIKLP